MPRFVLYPQASGWTSRRQVTSYRLLGVQSMWVFLTFSVFTEIPADEHLCCGSIAGEVFKLLEEEGVSLSELEPAPLDSV